MTITGGTKLPDQDIERMVKEAEAHAEEDRQRREVAEARNQLDSVVYQTEKTLSEHGDKLDESDKKHVEESLEQAKDALKGDDADQMRKTSDQLLTASQKFAEVMYQRAQAEQGATGTPGADDVVDAEVVDEGDQQSA
jgi:molecular chaperone DnaK